MDDVTLRELVDDLPTQSLELYVQHYEAGWVGGYMGTSFPRSTHPMWGKPYCPRCSLGFAPPEENWISMPLTHRKRLTPVKIHKGHPASQIEEMAKTNRLDNAELYSECVLAIAERDASLEDLPQPEREKVGAK